MRKGEIARYEQFLLLPQRFRKTCTADTGLVWEWVEPIPKYCNVWYEGILRIRLERYRAIHYGPVVIISSKS